MRFSNVWTSTGITTGQNANGFTFVGSGSTNPFPSILDVSLVNCVGKGFVGHDGLFARNVVGLSVIGSTFGDNYVGINIDANMSNFILNDNKCGAYVPNGYNPSTGAGNGNTYGIIINTGASDYYTIIGNLVHGNITAGVVDAGSGTHKQVIYNYG